MKMKQKVNKKQIEKIANEKIWRLSRIGSTIFVLLEKRSIRYKNSAEHKYGGFNGIKNYIWKARKW